MNIFIILEKKINPLQQQMLVLGDKQDRTLNQFFSSLIESVKKEKLNGIEGVLLDLCINLKLDVNYVIREKSAIAVSQLSNFMAKLDFSNFVNNIYVINLVTKSIMIYVNPSTTTTISPIHLENKPGILKKIQTLYQLGFTLNDFESSDVYLVQSLLLRNSTVKSSPKSLK